IALPLEEFHHYVTLKPGDLMFLVAPSGLSSARAVDTAIGAHAMGGQVVGLVSSGDSTLDGLLDWEYALPAIEESLAPLLFTIPLQLFAYHVAMEKFRM